MLTKAPFQSRDSEKGGGNALSHYVQTKLRIRAALEWRVEWAHVSEEVLNDNNNALRGRARNNSEGEGEKAAPCSGRGVAVRGETERSEEQRRGGGAQSRQEIPAEKVGPRPNYTALCQRLCTNAHEHACTLTNTHRH